MWKSSWRLYALALGLGWLALVIPLALTRAPWANEAWTAIPALNLARHGSMYTTVLESKDTWLRGVDRHTYWLMPLDLLVQAAWYKILGFGLFRQRLLSILWAALLLVCWSRIVTRLTGMPYAALFAGILIAFEPNFLFGAANGRMDAMCAALGSAGLAAWLELRDNSIRRALLVAHFFTAASIFTHPCGILFAAVLALLNLIGGRRIRLPDLLLVISPYLFGAALWGVYIAQAPGDFRAQFLGNSSGFAGEYSGRTRLLDLTAPWHALWDELRIRYLEPFGFYALTTFGGMFGAAWLLFSFAAAAVALASTELRANHGVRTLLASELLVFVLMALFEGLKFQHYLIYSLPFVSAVTACTVAWLWNHQRKVRPVLAGLILMLTVPRLKTTVDVIRTNPLRSETRAVADYLHSRLAGQDQVIGSAELGYFLGFDGPLTDDVRLGYHTGLYPRFIYTSGWYRLWHQAAAGRDPGLHGFLTRLLDNHYHGVFARGEYVVYERIPGSFDRLSH